MHILKILIKSDIFLLAIIVLFIFLLSCFFFGESISNIINLLYKYPRVNPENGLEINQQDSYIIHLGYLGSFLQGSIGLIVSIVIMFTIFITFYIERKRVKAQKFEDHFFHLLEIHRENVKMMEIDRLDNKSITGNKAILYMFRELMLIVEIFQIIYKKNINSELKNIGIAKIINVYVDDKIFLKEIDTVYIVEMSFYCFFFGAGKRSNRTLRYYLDERFSNYINVEALIGLLSNNGFRELIRKEKKFKYKIFGGHQTRLGHYYRHLYHTIKWIDSSDLSHNEKYEYYVKKLRIQLNTYEQALLAINSFTVFGNDWKKYIVDYKLIKNIPKNFFDEKTELGVEKILEAIQSNLPNKVNNYFEYQEQKIGKLQ